MKCIILLAGIGSRLGQPFPKCLNKLPYGETILQRQVRILKECGIHEIIGVCGFKKELVMEHMPDIFYKYNPTYYITNTSKSLFSGIKNIEDDLLWLNGDVVFDKDIIFSIINSTYDNKIAVDNKKCGEEEVKYICSEDGIIKDISKEVDNKYAEGEAIGINYISKKYIDILKKGLENCKDDDYFEDAIEFSIKNGVNFYPVNVENYKYIEVDFNEDWNLACKMFKS